MMTYREYVEKYDDCYGHDDYDGGESLLLTLGELLDHLKGNGYDCPDVVTGGIPVKITIYPESIIDHIECELQEDDFAGEDYEMAEEGKAYLKKCFQWYNKKYATDGNYRDSVEVIVPDEMKYELEEKQ